MKLTGDNTVTDQISAMFSHAENELLTQTGPGTPMGDLLRRYWLPAPVSRELA